MPIPFQAIHTSSTPLSFRRPRRDGIAALLESVFAPARRRETAQDAVPPDPYWQYRDRAEAIGRLYLEREPAERNVGALLRQLPDIAAQGDAASADEMRDAVAEWRKADFVGGDTVLLDGWIIARTEARLCALAALMGT